MGFDGFDKDDEYFHQKNKDGEYMEEGPLPGFRFHPTDEELVGFYLRRKLDKKPICLELIKQIDIYKFDPWDLPKTSSTNGDKEWYFFCKRGRKYRNSIRPNRVTGSGFWKATGIDKPVYSHGGDGKDCIGLKKTLVYYRGSAGKGTKTNWMMHEFRLPSDNATNNNNAPEAAEIWTLCRILKRNASQRKQFTTDVKQSSAAKRINSTNQKTSRTTSLESANANQEAYISFDKPHVIDNNTKCDQRHHQFHVGQLSSSVEMEYQPSQLFSNLWTSPAVQDLFTFDNWDELASVAKYGVDSIAYDINNRVINF